MKRFYLLLPFVLVGGACDDVAPVLHDATVDATDVLSADSPAPDATAPCLFDGGGDDPPEPTPHTPRWAFTPWISKDISDRDDTYAFVDGFRARDIPVGVVVLDSPWETHYNTFVPNPSRYGRFPELVRDMHARGVKVVLWITQFVNQFSFDAEAGGDAYKGPSPNLEEGLRCGFFVNGGAAYIWWKGRGASVDFFNPRARQWWHRQQDPLYDLGIDGWKLDFGDSYVTTPTVSTAAGEVPHQRYSEAYYRDFLAYGRQRRGPEFLTMVRPWDESYQFPGRFFARREHAPVAWVGDNRRDRVGMIDALDHIFRSAAANYPVVGSDLGGYLDRDDRNLTTEVPYDHVTFVRWIALAAMTPFMQLHGRANFAPWTVPTDPEGTTRTYRWWAKLHQALIPFWYGLSEAAWAGGPPILRPQGAMASWPGDYRYMLGEAFLVAPVLDETGRRNVLLPEGDWYDWWHPQGDVLPGGRTLTNVDTRDPTRIPLYVRRGAIIPMEVTDDTHGLGTTASAGALTVLVYPSARASTFPLREATATGPITAQETGTAVTVTLPSSTVGRWYLRVRADAPFAGVLADGVVVPRMDTRTALDTAPQGWWPDAANRAVWVKLTVPGRSASVRLTR
jgi:alpha-D-xyloside xylohydrolase